MLFTPQAWPAPTFYSLSLNGTSAYVDVVPVESSGVSLNITASITVEAWIKTNEFDKQDIIARFNRTASAGTDGGYAIRLLDDNKVATADSTICFELIAGVLMKQPKTGDDPFALHLRRGERSFDP
ncbi:MAG: hypothetical protein WAU45_16765 [Blastocatellia bacterium]